VLTKTNGTATDREIFVKLEAAGLRFTRPRLLLAGLLFGGPDRHISAEDLFREARRAGSTMSLATVYNTLNQFTGAGILREIAVEGHKSYFDTRVGPHYHYLNEATGELFDAPESAVTVSNLAAPPDGLEIAEIQVVIRLRSKKAA
jgi:Fur family iron response transcriptional regulator